MQETIQLMNTHEPQRWHSPKKVKHYFLESKQELLFYHANMFTLSFPVQDQFLAKKVKHYCIFLRVYKRFYFIMQTEDTRYKIQIMAGRTSDRRSQSNG